MALSNPNQPMVCLDLKSCIFNKTAIRKERSDWWMEVPIMQDLV